MSTVSQYETHAGDGDQRNARSTGEVDNVFRQGNENAHNNQDSKDSRSLNVRAAATMAEEQKQDEADQHAQSKPPTAAAKEQGHKPSRGAQIDEQIEKEEEQLLKDKHQI